MYGNESIMSLFLNTVDNTYDVGEEYFDSTLTFNIYGANSSNINGFIIGNNNNNFLWSVEDAVELEKYNNWFMNLDYSTSTDILQNDVIYCFNKDASILYVFSNTTGYLYSLNISNNQYNETLDMSTITGGYTNNALSAKTYGKVVNMIYVEHNGIDKQLVLEFENGVGLMVLSISNNNVIDLANSDVDLMYPQNTGKIKYYQTLDNVNYLLIQSTLSDIGIHQDAYVDQGNDGLLQFPVIVNDFILNPLTLDIYAGADDGVYDPNGKVLDGIGKVTCLTEDFIFTDQGVYAWPDGISFHKTITNVETCRFNESTLDQDGEAGLTTQIYTSGLFPKYDKLLCLRITYNDDSQIVYHYGNGLRFYSSHYPEEKITAAGLMSIYLWTDEMIDQGYSALIHSVRVTAAGGSGSGGGSS